MGCQPLQHSIPIPACSRHLVISGRDRQAALPPRPEVPLLFRPVVVSWPCPHVAWAQHYGKHPLISLGSERGCGCWETPAGRAGEAGVGATSATPVLGTHTDAAACSRCSAHLFISYLFLIYLFKVYLSYLFVFIDSWNSGGGGSFLLRSRGGWVSPVHFGSANVGGGGMPMGSCSHPVPFWEGWRTEEEESHQCREDIPSCRTSKPLIPPRRCAPSHTRLYLLARPPGVFLFGSRCI